MGAMACAALCTAATGSIVDAELLPVCPQAVSSRSAPIIRVMIFFLMCVSPFSVLGSTNNYHTTIRKSTEEFRMV